MAFAHAPLGLDVLGPAAKLVGEQAPAPMRKMVAAGLAPLPPRDLLVAIYQLWVENGEHADKAGKTVEGLPAPVLEGALADRSLPPGVLDLLARKLARNEQVIEAVVRHPMVDDETLIAVARVCSESICDLLATNETRWLRCPAIVASLFHNHHCRMSVIHRMLELAEREGVDLGLPAMDEIRQALAESGPVDESRDAMFAAINATEHAKEVESVALDLFASSEVDDDLELPELADDSELFEGELPEGEQAEAAEAAAAEQDKPAPRASELPPLSKERRLSQLLAMRPIEKIRTAMMGDKYDRSVLIRDSNKTVAMATIKSPKVRDDEAVAYAANRSLSYDVIHYISNRREWIKLYAVKLNLVMNPKTPMSRSLTLLAHLNQGDVQKVARSKNVPSALATAAKRKVQARQ